MATHSAQTNPAARHPTSSVRTMMRWLGAGTVGMVAWILLSVLTALLDPRAEGAGLIGAFDSLSAFLATGAALTVEATPDLDGGYNLPLLPRGFAFAPAAAGGAPPGAPPICCFAESAIFLRSSLEALADADTEPPLASILTLSTTVWGMPNMPRRHVRS